MTRVADETRQELLAKVADITSQVLDHATYLTEAHEIDDPLGWMADTANHLACEVCGWLNSMLCPECPGCGCYNRGCSGWRHREYEHDDDRDPEPCCWCGEPGCPGYCNVDDYNLRGYDDEEAFADD